jgi:hypothetical protein
MATQTNRWKTDEAVSGLFSDAVIALHQGSSPESVKSGLISRGVSPEVAEAIVEKAVDFRLPQRDRRGSHSDSSYSVIPSSAPRADVGAMLAGGLVCLVGILITAASYATTPSGGTYVMALGAILFGAFKFLQGLSGG